MTTLLNIWHKYPNEFRFRVQDCWIFTVSFRKKKHSCPENVPLDTSNTVLETLPTFFSRFWDFFWKIPEKFEQKHIFFRTKQVLTLTFHQTRIDQYRDFFRVELFREVLNKLCFNVQNRLKYKAFPNKKCFPESVYLNSTKLAKNLAPKVDLFSARVPKKLENLNW